MIKFIILITVFLHGDKLFELRLPPSYDTIQECFDVFHKVTETFVTSYPDANMKVECKSEFYH